jgi:hypothetical protein
LYKKGFLNSQAVRIRVFIKLKMYFFKGSSGILELESDSFKLNCSQTLTGIKFIVVSDLKQGERGQRDN